MPTCCVLPSRVAARAGRTSRPAAGGTAPAPVVGAGEVEPGSPGHLLERHAGPAPARPPTATMDRPWSAWGVRASAEPPVTANGHRDDGDDGCGCGPGGDAAPRDAAGDVVPRRTRAGSSVSGTGSVGERRTRRSVASTRASRPGQSGQLAHGARAVGAAGQVLLELQALGRRQRAQDVGAVLVGEARRLMRPPPSPRAPAAARAARSGCGTSRCPPGRRAAARPRRPGRRGSSTPAARRGGPRRAA